MASQLKSSNVNTSVPNITCLASMCHQLTSIRPTLKAVFAFYYMPVFSLHKTVDTLKFLMQHKVYRCKLIVGSHSLHQWYSHYKNSYCCYVLDSTERNFQSAKSLHAGLGKRTHAITHTPLHVGYIHIKVNCPQVFYSRYGILSKRVLKLRQIPSDNT